MTGPVIDTKAAVEAAKTVTWILPQAGKTAVLDQLVSDMTSEALKALSPEAREKLLQALTGTDAALTSQHDLTTISRHLSAILGYDNDSKVGLDSLAREGVRS